jgi:2-polyprenyl-6-methoxyphenol hydroxylase-like FAD-dependent oxidoreductase
MFAPPGKGQIEEMKKVQTIEDTMGCGRARMPSLQTTCCIVGGGPAGMLLGYLLARAGVDAIVLEKHADFFRDFRGDTVHPSTLQVLHELGLLQEFLKLPHQQLTSANGQVGDFAFRAADFTHLPSFRLRMQCEALNLLRDGATIVGVEARSPEGPVYIQADLVVGCDGRHATTRQAAGLEVREFGVPIDVLWFRISRKAGDPEQFAGNFNYGRALILINRGGYFQCGMIVPKGSFEQLKQHGLDAFREEIRRIAPYLGERVNELESWDRVKLLTVQINRLLRWHLPGLLCIGDAAHAMSPAGGVGINLAIQDAIAAANLLTEPLRAHRVTEALLARVQERREFPTRVTQWAQLNAHKAIVRVFETSGPLKAPWQLKTLSQIPGLNRVTAYLVGVGVRPEHVAGAGRGVPRRKSSLKKAAVHTGALLGAAVATLRALRG